MSKCSIFQSKCAPCFAIWIRSTFNQEMHAQPEYIKIDRWMDGFQIDIYAVRANSTNNVAHNKDEFDTPDIEK